MAHTVERSDLVTRPRTAELPQAHLRALLWVGVAAAASATVAWVSADLLALSREAFLVPYVLAACLVSVSFVRSTHVQVIAELSRNPLRAAIVTMVTTALMIGAVMVQPGAPRAQGFLLAAQVAWDGIVYGAVDGILLTVIPIAAAQRAFNRPSWRSDALALLANMVVFIAYHLGFPEFRGPAVAAPIVAALAFGGAYLAARNPAAPILAHAAMHVAAVLHGPAGTVQLPPHY